MIVFFVLCGLVVTLPVVRQRGFDWIAYFPRRVVRLMVPVVASVLLAAALFVMAIPQHDAALRTWQNHSSTPNFGWEYIVKAWDLLGGDGQINNPLWSLRWELLLALAAGVRDRGRRGAKVVDQRTGGRGCADLARRPRRVRAN